MNNDLTRQQLAKSRRHGFHCPRVTHNLFLYILPDVEYDYVVCHWPRDEASEQSPIPHGSREALFTTNRKKWDDDKIVARTRFWQLRTTIPIPSFLYNVGFMMTVWEQSGAVEYEADFSVIDPETITVRREWPGEERMIQVGFPDIWPVSAKWNGELWTLKRHPWMIENDVDWPDSVVANIETTRMALGRWMKLEQQRKVEGLPVLTNWLIRQGEKR
jgi:hypothetical protein